MPRSYLTVGLVLAMAAGARADPPVTTVYFGVSAARPSAEPTRQVNLRARPSGRAEELAVRLVGLDGRADPEARRALSLLARPHGRERPSQEELQSWSGDPEWIARDVRLLHPALVERLQRVAEAFEGHTIEIVSGYRPQSREASRHHHGRALDIDVEGIPRETLRDFLRTLEQTGVGWYPNGTFVHLDVREESAYWVDESGPGERPRYVRPASPTGRARPVAPAEAARAPAPIETMREDRPSIDDALEALRGLRVEAPAPAARSEPRPGLDTETLEALRNLRVPPIEAPR